MALEDLRAKSLDSGSSLPLLLSVPVTLGSGVSVIKPVFSAVK